MENKALFERDEILHELKNFLNVIGGYVDAVLDGTVPQEKIMQCLELVSSEIKRMSELIASNSVKNNEVDVRKALECDISLMSIAAEKRCITVSISGEARIYGAEALVRQLLFNVLENALKYADDGGTINIEIEEQGGNAVVKVRNSGSGIPEDMLENVFQKHFTASQGKNGTGLGLYIAREIVLLHGGEISINSKENEYTEISIVLPLNR